MEHLNFLNIIFLQSIPDIALFKKVKVNKTISYSFVCLALKRVMEGKDYPIYTVLNKPVRNVFLKERLKSGSPISERGQFK